MLRYRVNGTLDEATYLHFGRYIASQLVQCLSAHGVALDNATLLDFACGPGRVATEVKALVPSCRLHGSDIDRDAIGWAQEHLRHVGNFAVNDPTPPTRYPGAFFDVVYSVSLFTHLDERSQEGWLEELARILKPGGVLIVTTHGKFALESCTDAELDELGRRGIVYRVGRKGRFKLDGLPDFYQTTFHTREYVSRAWSRHFDVVDHIEGGLGGHQDLVLLRRPNARS
jgi:ubiquinone/menaquinone biosynthesis C-methylase UbiE